MSRNFAKSDFNLTIPFGSGKDSFEEKCDLTENAITVLNKRYLKRNLEGEVVETPEDMFKRVAESV